MITETELAQALDNILGYVVTAVICCGEEGCQEPNCWSCWGSEKAEWEAKIANDIFQASGKVLKAWKEWEKAERLRIACKVLGDEATLHPLTHCPDCREFRGHGHECQSGQDTPITKP